MEALIVLFTMFLTFIPIIFIFVIYFAIIALVVWFVVVFLKTRKNEMIFCVQFIIGCQITRQALQIIKQYLDRRILLKRKITLQPGQVQMNT